jgi:6-phosphofructokinase 2
MIVTVTFNPCIDGHILVEKLVPNDKLPSALVAIEAGGGGINVSRALHNLGGRSNPIFPCGGHRGKIFMDLVSDEGLQICPYQVAHETRENIIIHEQTSQQEFRIGFDGESDGMADFQKAMACLSLIQDITFLVISGSFPLHFPNEAWHEIDLFCRQKNAKLVVDTSGKTLFAVLALQPFLIKPNLREFSILVGKEDLAIADLDGYGKSMITKYNVQNIVVSLGPQGSTLITKDEFIHVKPQAVDVLSTVGAGDSTVAGLLYGFSQDLSLYDTLKYGVACGTAATLTTGNQLCQKADVDRLFAQLI